MMPHVRAGAQCDHGVRVRATRTTRASHLISSDDLELARDADGRPVVLGAGSFGQVFKAVLHGLDEVAIKTFSFGPLASSSGGTSASAGNREPYRQQLLNEVALLRACSTNRNIVQARVHACSRARVLALRTARAALVAPARPRPWPRRAASVGRKCVRSSRRTPTLTRSFWA